MKTVGEHEHKVGGVSDVVVVVVVMPVDPSLSTPTVGKIRLVVGSDDGNPDGTFKADGNVVGD